MKTIFHSTLLLLCSVLLFTSCEKDTEMNPILTSPTQFVLNTPAAATNGVYDLGESKSLTLTCSQPDYGFPATTQYVVEVATKEDMSDATELSTVFTTTVLNLDGNVLASTLTNMMLANGYAQQQFPLTIPVYFRVKAQMTADGGDPIANTAITSNVVKLNQVYLPFSLPDVTTPEDIYIIGNFCGWNWDKSLTAVHVYDTNNQYWHLVYIDESGIKFGTVKQWGSGEIGHSGIRKIGGDLASEIVASSDGNIATTKPGWYLMVITAEVVGRDIEYDVDFNKPNVYLTGSVSPGAWNEDEASLFTVPTTADGDFVSPAFVANSDDGGVRACVRLAGHEWWHTEFMVFDKKIVYRGKGGDQDRVAGSAGQQLHLNFTTETGEIK